MERDFRYFIERYGEKGASEKFEGACYNMLKHQYPYINVNRMRENPGDEGIDIYVGDLNEPIDVYQCKFFMNELHYGNINKSLERAVYNKNYKLNEWYLLVPKRLNIQEDKTWSIWKKRKEEEYSIKIHLMNGDEIILRMKDISIYDEIFDIKESMHLEYLYNWAFKSTTEIQENMNFLIDKIVSYTNKRIVLIKDLYKNSYNIKEYLLKNKVNSFKELFNKVSREDRFLFHEIDTIVEKIERQDAKLAFFCKEYVFIERICIDDIEEKIHYSDEYLFSLEDKVFEVILLNIISELEKELGKIENIIKHNYKNVTIADSMKLDLRDNIILYMNNKLELLANHLVNLVHCNAVENYEIFYGNKDKEAIELGDVFSYILYSNSRIPFPTSMYKLIDYIDMKYSKINEKGNYSFSLETTNIIFLDELDNKTLGKLMKIKDKAHLKFHFFIKSERYNKFLEKNGINKKEIKVISDYYYLTDEVAVKTEMENLLKNQNTNIPEMLFVSEIYNGLVITNGQGLVIRNRKNND